MSAAPIAGTATRSPRAPRPRRWRPRCSAARRGVCGGRAGSMNVVDLEHGLVGCFGIVGGSIAAATGAALSAKRQGGVSVAFFGDGAANQAVLPRVPQLRAGARAAGRLRVREQPLRRVHADGRRSPRAARSPPARAPTRSPSTVVDGNDLWAVREAATEAVERARAGERPDAARVPDLPALRTLEVRPGEVPARRRARALDGARPADDRPRAPARRRDRRGRGRRGRDRGAGRELERADRRPRSQRRPYPRSPRAPGQRSSSR